MGKRQDPSRYHAQHYHTPQSWQQWKW